MLRDAFGRLRPIRWGMINLGGYLTVLQLRVLNKLRIEGVENLKRLPSRGVLLVSNHLTYYMDAIVVFHSVSYLRRPYLIWPRTDFYIVAALETMRARGWLPRLMAYNGTISVKRTWKEGDQAVQRAVDPEDIAKVHTGLQGGWVLTFPQGTTAPGAPGRTGTARIMAGAAGPDRRHARLILDSSPCRARSQAPPRCLRWRRSSTPQVAAHFST